ncbi:MAG: NYN domain-containing protein [Thermomicrobiales bacterium]
MTDLLSDRTSGASREGAFAGQGDVALLIDWENLKYSLQNQCNAAPNISSLVNAAREFGRLVVARAYADWTQPQLRVDAPNLYRAGIEPIYVPGRFLDGQPIKNSADVRLAVDSVDLCVSLHHVSSYVLVTGDGDLIHSLNFLRLRGRQVVIVGVTGTIKPLLETAADAVMIYERDIEPLIGARRIPASPQAAGAHSLERVFGWVREILRDYAADRPYPFTQLGHYLKLRHAFDSRKALGIPLKDVMQRAQTAGVVHLSTIGGFDYAELPRLDDAQPEVPGADESRESEPAPAAALDLQFGSLDADEQRRLMHFIADLQHRSRFMTFKYLLERIVYNSVLPRLSQDQVGTLINALAEHALLQRRPATGYDPATGAEYTYATLTLDLLHPVVREALAVANAAADAARRDTGRPDPFATLPDALEDTRRDGANWHISTVQHALEARLGARLHDYGFARPMLFFQEAETRGIARVVRRGDGSVAVVPPDIGELENVQVGIDPLERLGAQWTPAALRILAQVEDEAEAPVGQAPRVYALRTGLQALGAPMLGSGETDRLIRRSFVGSGWVREEQVTVLDASTGLPRLMVTYPLCRDNPEVQAALRADAVGQEEPGPNPGEGDEV